MADSTTELVLLGTGTPVADPQRKGPSVAVVVNDEPYLVDFGPGVVRQAAAAHQRGVKGLAVDRLRQAFVTHLHSDHTAGYPDLALSPWVLGRRPPLEVYGPKGIKHMTEHLLTAYAEDIDIRLQGSEPCNDSGYRVIAREVEPGIAYEDEHVKVEAFLVDHGNWRIAFGYRFTTPDRTIVLSGDTRPCKRVADMAADCDILVHEVYSEEAFRTRSPDWQAYHREFHTSSKELAGLAAQARPKLLVLYHQLFWGVSDGDLVEEIREGFDGDVVCGRDLDVF